MTVFKFEPGQHESAVLNPVAACSEGELTDLLRTQCIQADSATNRVEIEDQIAAMVPAVIELRDSFGLGMNIKVLSEFGTLAGFSQLADDVRLSDLARQRCKAIHTRLVVMGVKAILGHTKN